MDESELQKRVDEIDNEDEHTTAIEYCVLGCDGSAHFTGVPDSESHFCELNVHRSVHIKLKKGVFALGETESLG
jgi:hypothetical protein